MRDISKKLSIINTGERKKTSESSVTTQYISGGGGSIGGGNFLPKQTWDKVFEIRTTDGGEEYLFSKLNFVLQYGLTAFADVGNLDLPDIYDGLKIDNQTIYWAEVSDEKGNVTKVLKAVGGGGGVSSDSVLWGNVKGKPSWITETKPEYDYSEIRRTPDLSVYAKTDWVTSQKYAKESTLETLAKEVANKWTKDDTKIANWDTAFGWGNHSNAGYVLKTYVDDNFYTKNESDAKFIGIKGNYDIDGVKNFIGELQVNGCPIFYDKEKKYWKFEGDLLVTGGVSTFSSDLEFEPTTIMDGINCDGITIHVNEYNQLEVIGGGNGDIPQNREGYIILRQDIPLQEQFAKANTIYECRFDLDLGGSNVSVPIGSTILINEGSFHNGSFILYDNTTFEGNNAHISANLIVRGKNVSITNVSIECAGICIYGENNYNTSDLLIENCTLKSTGDNCVKIITDTLDGVVYNFKAINTEFYFYRMGIELQNHGNDNIRFSGGSISKCRFEMLSSFLYGYAISLTGRGEHISIGDCYFDKCYMGIELVGFNHTVITDNTINNGRGEYLIAATNVRRMTGTIIANNTFIGQQMFITNSVDTQIMGNTFSDCVGVVFTNTSKSLFKDNNCVFKSNCSVGIMLDNAYNNRIENNQLDMTASANFYSVMRAYGSLSKYNVFKENFIAKPEGGSVFDQINDAASNYNYDYYLISNGSHVDGELQSVRDAVTAGDNNVLGQLRKNIKGSYVLLQEGAVGMLYGSDEAGVTNPTLSVKKQTALANNKLDMDLHFMFRKDNNQYWAKVQLTDSTYDLKNPVFNTSGNITAKLEKTSDGTYTYYNISFSGTYNDAIVYGVYFATSANWTKWL